MPACFASNVTACAWRALAAAFLIVGSQGAASSGALAPEKLARVTAFFNDEIATGRIPGAVVLIEQHGKPIYLNCFGVRDMATHAAMTPDTIFALHSMTKPITNFAAMMLIDQGKLGLDDPVSKYIAAFADTKVGVEIKPGDGDAGLRLIAPDRPITIRDLMRQTSGITYDYIGAPAIKKAYADAGIFAGKFDNRKFADRIAALPLARQPGTLWRYGHSTDVLGRVIEVVSGQSLNEFEKQNLLDPLGMTDTRFVLETPDQRARMAEPLPSDRVLVASEQGRREHPEWQSGGGGLLSTVEDYARFARMLLQRGVSNGHRFLSEKSFAEMTADQIGPGSGVARDYFYFPGDGFGYGLGLAVRTDPGLAHPPAPGSLGELKWDSGSGTYFGVDPKEDMIFVLFEQTGAERGRIIPAVKKLLYDALVD